jgi:hypothetical protein
MHTVAIAVDPVQVIVSGIFDRPSDARGLYLLAHGAGAGMRHPFLADLSSALSAIGIATLRYQFPYMELARGRPDPPVVATATVRAAVEKARELAPDLTLVAGGKSFGGRMTSTAAAESPLTGVEGIVFLGFPLHQPRSPATARAEHLGRVTVPMLFLQGTRDEMAEIGLIRQVAAGLGSRASLVEVAEANHSFAVPKRTGKTSADLIRSLAASIRDFTSHLSSRPQPSDTRTR